MSHVVTLETQVRDPAAIAQACERLKLPPPRHGTFELFATEATGWSVQLPGWTFPIVCDTQAGKVLYDNFEERWGSTSELNTFLQRYAAEAARLAARRQGHTVLEQALADGSIRLVIQAGGAA